MRKAIGLAERGRGTTSPNPMVGALVVDGDGVVVGRGAHLVAGGPHAEVVALEDAGARATGATLYCTLEPCSHTGRTGPCAPLVAESGIRRVVVAMEDPNPLVNGRGLAHLRARGVEVVSGVEREAAERQNVVFLTGILQRRPFVVMKVALSVDGCVAAAAGERTPLTGPVANRRVQRQRAEVDAVGVGSGTILADDPLLTARGVYRSRALTRVIFDRRLRTPPSARVLSTLVNGPVIIVCSAESERREPGRAAALKAAGASLLVPERDDLPSAFRALFDKGVTSIVVEGGAALHRSMFETDMVDAAQVYITPHRLGPGGLRWLDAGRIAWDTVPHRYARWLGEDLLVEGQLKEASVHVHRDR